MNESTAPQSQPGVPHRCDARRGVGKPKPKRPKRAKRPLKSWKLSTLLEAVKQFVEKRRDDGGTSITAEEVAFRLRANKGMVTDCFVKLVACGIMGRKERGMRADGCWWASTYRIVRKRR